MILLVKEIYLFMFCNELRSRPNALQAKHNIGMLEKERKLGALNG